MLTFSAALNYGKSEINQENATLDVELLLAYATHTTRSHIHAWPEKQLEAQQEKLFLELISRAKQGEPISYLINKKEFWSLELLVTKDTLIPRPETELLVEIILKNFPQQTKLSLLDLGTGSGAIALAIAKERPQWEIVATDISSEALAIAKRNATNLGLHDIIFQQSDWYEGLSGEKFFDVIVSNPPYIDEEDAACALNVKAYEPHLALFSEEQGLADLKKIICQGKAFLQENGFLLVEHGYEQAAKVNRLFAQNGYENIHLLQDLAGLDRITGAYKLK